MMPLLLAAGSGPDPVVTELASSLLLLCWLVVVLLASVASLGAVCVIVPALLPGKVLGAADQASRHPGRCTLLGAINVVGGVVLAGVLTRDGGALGLIAVAIFVVLGYFALIGLSGLGGAVGQALAPKGTGLGPLPAAAGGGLMALACFFPLLGQIFAGLCLFCAVGSAVSAARSR